MTSCDIIEKANAAKQILRETEEEMRRVAIDEARKSLADAGFAIEKTFMTLDLGKMSAGTQRNYAFIINVACWLVPEQPKMWQFQAHYVFAKRDGSENRSKGWNYIKIACDKPSDFARKLFDVLPILGWSK